MSGMLSTRLRDGLWMLTLSEPDRRRFGRAAYTDLGVMRSCFLLDTGDGFVLIGSLPPRCLDEGRG